MVPTFRKWSEGREKACAGRSEGPPQPALTLQILKACGAGGRSREEAPSPAFPEEGGGNAQCSPAPKICSAPESGPHLHTPPGDKGFSQLHRQATPFAGCLSLEPPWLGPGRLPTGGTSAVISAGTATPAAPPPGHALLVGLLSECIYPQPRLFPPTTPAMLSCHPPSPWPCSLQPDTLKCAVQLGWVWPENIHPSQPLLWKENEMHKPLSRGLQRGRRPTPLPSAGR